MHCTETDSRLPAIRVTMPIDLAKDISYLLTAIRELGGNGRIQLTVSGGSVIDTEVTVKRSRGKKSA